MAKGTDVGEVLAGAASRAATGAADYIERNRAAWEQWAPQHLSAARRGWEDDELRWGLWNTPESKLEVLRSVREGDDVIELGSGTAEVSAWLARHGARPFAVDFARTQIRNLTALQREFDVSFPALHSDAEQVRVEDESFDVAVSEYGVSVWCDPHRWLPEAHRLLRAGGQLIFVTNSAFLMACTPGTGERAGDQLVRDYFTSPVREYPDGVVEFHLTHGNWVELLGAYGLVVERLVELRPPHGTKPRFDFVSLDWARRWPSEEIWVARKTR